MPVFLKRRSSLAFATVLIFLAGVIAGAWRYSAARDHRLHALLVEAQRSAAAFDDTQLIQLEGNSGDLDTPLHARTSARLLRLQRIDPSLRALRLLRKSADDAPILVLALAGSTEPSSALPGEALPDSAHSPALLSVLATAVPVAEGPFSGPLGPFVSVYAPIGDFDESAPRHLLQLDVVAYGWNTELWTAALGTAGYVWLLLVLPLVALIASRRDAEHRDAVRNLTEAMEQGHSAVIIIDLERRIEYANAAFCRQLGYRRRELVGREWRELHNIDAQPELIAEIVTTVSAGQPWAGEWLMQRKDGSSFPARGRVTPVKDRAGRVRAYVAVFDDVTDLRQTEMLLREAKERAEAGDRAKGQFLATMSHEVRTPLNGIVGFASLLLDTELTPEQQEYVETIRTSSETLIQLTGDILDFARIESGRLKLDLQPCDPRECIENALDLTAAAAIQKNLELLHWIEDDVPAAVVADVNRLRQVVVNLVNNAVKFTADGEVEVRLRTLPLPARAASTPTPSECLLEFSVRDTGIGIPAEHHEKIFRPFSQVDESTTRRYGGTGLGLAICKNIVELMGGTISFASEPNRGSTFTFTIRASIAAPAAPSPQPLSGQRLAIVTRSGALRDELSRLGARFGATVLHREEKAIAEADDWDLAVVDVTGPAAMDLALQHPPRPGLSPQKIVALVPIVLPGELRDALRSHFRYVLNKPLHHDMLRSLLGAPAESPDAISSAPSAPPARDRIAAHYNFDVLIVEDNAVNQRLIQKVVANLGCRWTAAENGRVALNWLAHNTPDLVLMDLHMPELDGLSAITKIRAGDAGADKCDLWIIALTADAREDQRTRTLAAGANDYLTKPVRLRELTAAFDRFKDERL
jgi:PAS domain S-box